MSITILQQPSLALNSSNNDSIFVITGSSGYTSSVEDFKYIADVYVAGTRVTTLKTFPDPSYGYGVFNLRNIVPNFVSYDVIYNISQDTGSVFHSASNSSTSVSVYFGREFVYNNGFSQSRGEVSSSNFNYINSSLSFIDQSTLSLSNYLVTSASSSTVNFLTKANFTIPTYANLRNYLYYYLSSSVGTALNITTYDGNNNQLGQYYVSNTITGSYNGVQIVATGYSQLSLLISGSATNNYHVITGNSVMFNSSVSSYVVQLTGTGGITFTKPVSYKVNQDCSRFGPYAYAVYWLNTLGGFDSWLFNKTNTVNSTKTQSQYKKIVGQLNANGTYGINTYSSAIIPFYTEVNSSIQLSTDFLTDQQVKYLKGLYDSPVIYLQDPNGNLISATIDDSTPYSLNQKNVNTKAYALTLTFIPSVPDYRQSL